MNLIPGFKQVLTRGGWVEIQEYYERLKRSCVDILVIYKGHCIYASPKSFASSYYNGSLIELTTNTSRVILKPSFKIEDKKMTLINKGNRLPKFFSYQEVDRTQEVEWDGEQFLLFFGEPVQLPINFENDYILISV